MATADTKQNTIRPGRLFELAHYRNGASRTLALHHHDDYELFFMLDGEVDYCVESHKMRLRAGDVMLVSPQELHRVSPANGQEDYERLVVWISKGFIAKYSTEKTDLAACFTPGTPNMLRGNTSQQNAMQFCARRLEQIADSEEFGADVDAARCLLELLVSVNRLALRTSPVSASDDNTSRVIAGVISYINKHYCEDLSLDGLAERFFISKYHLSHAFQRQIGTSVYRYIIQKRLQMARQMLRNQTPPSEVYMPCGFGDYANFYRAFKLEYAMSPKQFMQQSLRQI